MNGLTLPATLTCRARKSAAYGRVRRKPGIWEGPSVIRIFVAEPMTLTREGLVALLSREHDIELIATVQRAEEVVPAARALKPDVVLLAAAFPGHDGIDIARALRAALPECRCAILSSGRRLRDIQRAIAAQVHGFLVHDCPAEFLTEAIRQLASGKKVIDPSLALERARKEGMPAYEQGSRGAPRGRARIYHRGDCREPLPYRRHRTQLPVARDREDRRPQPGRCDPAEPRSRAGCDCALLPASAKPGSPGAGIAGRTCARAGRPGEQCAISPICLYFY